MGTVFRWVALCMIAVAILIVGMGALMPRQWSARSVATVNAQPRAILEAIGDLRTWPNWAARPDLDPSVTYDYAGSPGEVGAVQRYTGKKFGHGHLEITSISERSIALRSYSGERLHSELELRVANASGVSEVTWSESGTLPPIIGAFLRDSMQSGVSAHHEVALGKLKHLVERRALLGAPSP